MLTVQTLQVASPVPVYLSTSEMASTAEVTQVKIYCAGKGEMSDPQPPNSAGANKKLMATEILQKKSG